MADRGASTIVSSSDGTSGLTQSTTLLIAGGASGGGAGDLVGIGEGYHGGDGGCAIADITTSVSDFGDDGYDNRGGGGGYGGGGAGATDNEDSIVISYGGGGGGSYAAQAAVDPASTDCADLGHNSGEGHFILCYAILGARMWIDDNSVVMAMTKINRCTVLIGAAALAFVGIGTALAQTYGSQVMSPEERAQHRSTMRSLSPSEREAYRAEHHEVMKQRGKSMGLTVPDQPPVYGRGYGRRGPGYGYGPGPGYGYGPGYRYGCGGPGYGCGGPRFRSPYYGGW